ncbi:16S rRNA (cytosine(1402)-N(4))-methyltransferase RsmH [Sporolactobacillus sp. CQH2019]|uniref:16S rRNA (cytosine(1402)-N(4))-methyltransferase RsmH n=1 Tax=Sporolactobacillus sp. CQH2019 TaxID=3023512 RepID=UPI0023679408|nr:16S rRNA (cytosine(1402)-N(4))-methyltransferase RsmH [Sporolactobacillus sp. CQH2019]MDD9147164.1 16S rRNA (cytosine(1402)-N(4))-methyltransferase RsmH [Sporolactobacillus sp. CQH2019]
MFEHITVLKHEAVDGLAVKPDGVYLDCTLGGGGHSEEIVKRLRNGRLYAFDQDQEALDAAEQRLKDYRSQITFIKSNFRKMKSELAERDVRHVDGILFDLGVSSPQFDHAERGFSYQHDGPLDMRMDRDQDLSAETVVNDWPYEKLTHIFFMYGEERFSRQIAKMIEKRRAESRIKTTGELAEIVKEAIPAPARRTGGHPAKRVFQALRIAVNDELGSLEEALYQSLELINIGGRISVITFQSLEDRLCKQFFKKYSEPPELPPGLPVLPLNALPVLKRIGRKPVLPSEEELKENHRAHSAKLRVAEKIRAIKEETV